MASFTHWARGWASLAVGAAIVIATGPAEAAGNPKVLVLPYQHMNKGMPDDLGEQTTVVVAREIAAQGLNVIRADDVAGGPAPSASAARPSDAPTGDPRAQAKAEKYIERARSAMDDSEFERATKFLSRAAKAMEDNGDAVPDLRLLSEIYLQAGIAYFRDGMEDEGDDMLNKAVHYDPERVLQDSDYPPIFIRVFERARFNVLRRPRARIEVNAKPGATVLFDGRNLGKAPLVLTEALPGQHWIRVERPGEEVQVKKIQARGRKTLVVDFEGAGDDEPVAAPSDGVLGGIAANALTADHMTKLGRAGKKAGADFVMFGGIYKTDTAYQIRTAYLQVSTGKVGRITEIAFDLDMLSAEIEVFKLVDDAKNQAESGELASVVDDFPVQLAPKLRPPRRRRVATAGVKAETRLTTVVAAPPPIKAPTAPVIEEARGPLATGPTNDGSATKTPARKAPSLVPKDEVGTAMAPPPPTSPGLTAGTLVPKDEKNDDDEGSLWWVWVIAGVAVAGAATAGGIALAGSGSSDQGNLTINW